MNEPGELIKSISIFVSEGMWKNWNPNSLLVDLRADSTNLESDLALCPKLLNCLLFDSEIPLLSLFTKMI